MSKQVIEIIIDEENECFHDSDGDLTSTRLDSLENNQIELSGRVESLEDFTQIKESLSLVDLAAQFILMTN